MNPFVNLNAQPSYGSKEVLLSWRVLPGYTDGLFFVYRSMTGTSPWELLNDTTEEGGVVAIYGTYFVDEEFIVENRVVDTHYRLLLRMPNGEEFESPVVSMFGQLTRKEWGGACKMMLEERQRMCTGNGVPVYQYIPLAAGELNPNFDPDTGQDVTAECPDTNTEDDSYGLKYKGGYGPAINTWIEFMDVGPIIMQDRDDGQGHQDPITIKARMLAHPKPSRGQLIIHPPSDNRYVVGDTIKGWYFKGIVAIAYDMNLHLLRRSDARYRVPLPKTTTTYEHEGEIIAEA